MSSQTLCGLNHSYSASTFLVSMPAESTTPSSWMGLVVASTCPLKAAMLYW